MDTNRLKRFATEARNILMQGVAHRFTALGFLPDGTVTEEPQPLGGGATFMGDTVSEDFYQKWCSLQRAVNNHSIEEVAEEAAYTWFNRMMAIRIMVKNGLTAPVLQYESEGVHIPLLVTAARQGRMPDMSIDDQRKLEDLLLDDSKTDEQFRILIVAFCHDNPVINKCFGHISDYTELLLPSNILAEGGFVDMLNNTEFISEEDYHSPELIGWLYQFYISEKKDDVFASFKKGKKAEAKDIPAATQIFTPNWIVKYMVQNTIGRIYLDNNPYEEDIQENWKYLVEPTEKTSKENILHYDDLKELKFADLASGSGHILNEGFDILYELYKLEGYSPKKAIENIFLYNLTGVDIDTRAQQLAQFALLLKACQKDNSFADAHLMPRVFKMPEPYPYKDNLRNILPDFFIGGNQQMIQEVIDAIVLMDQAKNLGSIMKFDISETTRNAIAIRMEEYDKQHSYSDEFEELLTRMRIIMILTEKYSALVMNPPYMGQGNMNNDLKNYLNTQYEDGKTDLFSAFLYKSFELIKPNGYIGYLAPYVWMFISSYEELRYYLLKNYNISSLIQLEYNAFEPACVPVATFTLQKTDKLSYGCYIRLVDFKGHLNQSPRVLEALSNHNCGFYYETDKSSFSKITGSPITYWFSENESKAFDNGTLESFCTARKGMYTGENALYVRIWHEVDYNALSCYDEDNPKWRLYANGGGYRKWGGFIEDVVYWENNGEKLRRVGKYVDFPSKAGAFNIEYIDRVGSFWTAISNITLSARYLPKGVMFSSAANAIFDNSSEDYFVLGLLNNKCAGNFLKGINPTLNYNAGDIKRIPSISYTQEIRNNISSIVEDCVTLSNSDWDAHETSWKYQCNELLMMNEDVMMENIDYLIEQHYKETGEHLCIDPVAPQPESVEWCYDTYCSKWNRIFMQLHSYEEELNRQFIEIYGLKGELTYDVPLEDITILQQGEIVIENNQLIWNADVVMKQLISYAIGCMMGRYSIDKPGIILANQGDGLEQFNEQVSNSHFEPDDDGIIPLMSAQSDFADNATIRFKQWLVAAFGEETLVENLNFIEKCLGKSIDDYFVKDFWKDHKKMYQNRPIYWLFSSKKGAFQCLAYMHRMDAYTAERIRTKYLLPHIEWLIQKQGELEANAANLNARERKELDNIGKQIEECREYHDRLHVIADKQIAFDLDDGVVVNYAKFGDVLSKLK